MNRNLQHKETRRLWISRVVIFLPQQHIVPGGDGNFSQAVEQHSGGQADKRHHGAIEEFQLPHQDVGSLGAGRDLLHEVEIDLGDMHRKIRV